MTRYQLLKVVTWAETLHSRKRLQKVVFMLQAAGCPLEADFYLHPPGVYSEDVARLTDELVRLSLLDEQETENSTGQVYSYRLAEPTKEKMGQLEQTEQGRPLAAAMAPFEPLARELLQLDVKELEVAATKMYFHRYPRNGYQSVPG